MRDKKQDIDIQTPAANERFGVMAAVARRNGSANLKVCTPQEVQWKPPLRQAAPRYLSFWDSVGAFWKRKKTESCRQFSDILRIKSNQKSGKNGTVF